MAVMAAMMMPLVVAPALVPSAVVTASAVPSVMPVTMMPVAVVAAMPDLDQAAVFLGGEGRHAQPGGSRQAHCQRGNKRRADQNDTSHAGSSHRLIAMLRHKFPGPDLFPAGVQKASLREGCFQPQMDRSSITGCLSQIGKNWQYDRSLRLGTI